MQIRYTARVNMNTIKSTRPQCAFGVACVKRVQSNPRASRRSAKSAIRTAWRMGEPNEDQNAAPSLRYHSAERKLFPVTNRAIASTGNRNVKDWEAGSSIERAPTHTLVGTEITSPQNQKNHA